VIENPLFRPFQTQVNASLSKETWLLDEQTSDNSAYRKSIKDYNEQVTKNRYILNRIIECVKFCGAFELALRGHDESDLSANPGIFRGLLDLMAEVDTIFKEHIEKSSIFKGVSKTIQNELLDSMLQISHNQIVTEIEQSDFVAIQADETTDISNKTQLVIIFRYVLNDTVCEHFWKFINPAGTTANHITDKILRELEISKISQNPEKLIAQSYDRAAVMCGKLGGVQVKQSKGTIQTRKFYTL
jgi:predicted SnoaL-like aldol condensation-catalyzing enzyme